MIMYLASATFESIANSVLYTYRLNCVPNKPKPIDKQVMSVIGYAAEVRVKYACDPILQSLSNLEKVYASLNYNAVDRRLVVVRTNMGLCLRQTGETSNTNGVL